MASMLCWSWLSFLYLYFIACLVMLHDGQQLLNDHVQLWSFLGGLSVGGGVAGAGLFFSCLGGCQEDFYICVVRSQEGLGHFEYVLAEGWWKLYLLRVHRCSDIAG